MMTIFKPLMKRRLRHKIGFMVYDAVAICAALTIAVALRMNGAIPAAMLHGMAISLPVFMVSGLVIFQVTGVYERIWRLGSLGDLSALVESATISIVVPVFALVISSNARWMPSSVPIIQWFVLVALLAGGRLWRRILSERLRTLRMVNAPPDRLSAHRPRQRALIVGVPEYVEIILRQLETALDPDHVAIGILDVSDQNVTMRLRHVPVLGGIDALEHVVGKLASQNERPTCLIIAEGGTGLTGPAKVKLVTAAETLGLTVLRATAPTAISKALDLETLNLADLLDRPQARLDEKVVAHALPKVELGLGVMERELSHGQDYLLGAELSLADFFMMPSTFAFQHDRGRPKTVSEIPRLLPMARANGELADHKEAAREPATARADCPCTRMGQLTPAEILKLARTTRRR